MNPRFNKVAQDSKPGMLLVPGWDSRALHEIDTGLVTALTYQSMTNSKDKQTGEWRISIYQGERVFYCKMNPSAFRVLYFRARAGENVDYRDYDGDPLAKAMDLSKVKPY